MNEPKTSSGFVGWLNLSLLITFVTIAWSFGLQMEDMRRKGLQRTFGPSPPLLPEWQFYVADVLLVVQLAIGGVAVWRVKTGRGYLATILLGLWISTFLFAGGFALGIR